MSGAGSNLLRSSAWVNDDDKVEVEMVWINADLARYSARVMMTREQALRLAEKLQSAVKGE